MTTHPYSVSLGVGDLAAKLEFDAVEMVNGSPLMGVANGPRCSPPAGAHGVDGLASAAQA